MTLFDVCGIFSVATTDLVCFADLVLYTTMHTGTVPEMN